jgi:hypothetical protein
VLTGLSNVCGAVTASDNGNGIKVITVKTDFKIITPRLLALLRLILHDLGYVLLAATINAGEQTCKSEMMQLYLQLHNGLFSYLANGLATDT